jgi:hypothetical protein
MGENYMVNKFRWVLIAFFLGIIIFLSIINTVTGANPTVGDIKLTPANPAPQSDVTFSVDITGDSISSVRIVINECDKPKGICHAPPQNVSMNKKSGNTYETKVKLLWDDVTSITYHIELKSDGKWIEYEDHTTTLSTNSGVTNDSNGSPGFEIIIFLVAIICVILQYNRYKSK